MVSRSNDLIISSIKVQQFWGTFIRCNIFYLFYYKSDGEKFVLPIGN